MRKSFFRVADIRLRFIAVGIVNTAAGFVIFTLFYFLLIEQVPYLLVLLMSQVFAVLLSHFTQRKFVWKSKAAYMPELAKFGSSYLLITLVNFVALSIAVESLNLSVLLSQYVIGAILILSMYLVQKKWVFSIPNS